MGMVAGLSWEDLAWMVEDLKAENDRLREALKQISARRGNAWATPGEVARAALERKP